MDRLSAHNMSPTSLWGFILLLLLGLLVITVAITPEAIFGEHIPIDRKYELHPFEIWGHHQLHEITIMEVWIQIEEVYVPFESKCHPRYTLTEDGRCALKALSWWIYPLRLMTEMPGECDVKSIGCVLDTGIHIINGKQNTRPSHGGCSVLWHEILHIKWGWMEVEEAHDRMEREFPNEVCAVKQHSKQQ
jgi:hypothetical protein